MRVLIADDDAGTRLLISAALMRLGHDCVEAASGDEALQLFTQAPPDVVITDLRMPGAIDGSALISRVRAMPDVDYAYVMVVTGHADEATGLNAMEAGADDLVMKPLDPADLERKLIAAARVTTLHRRLHRDARQDPLTGIGNRLRLAEDVEALCGRVARYGHMYCAALLDVDNFKAYNDQAGHLPGDEVLRSVADALARTIRSGDTLYRYGGEEFLVLLPEQTLDGAALAGERLRLAVEELGLPHPDGGAVTVSVGVAGMGDASCTPEELFEHADRALYRAKENGRNRVELEPMGAPVEEERPIRLLIADDDEGTRLMLTAIAHRDTGLDLVGAAARRLGGDPARDAPAPRRGAAGLRHAGRRGREGRDRHPRGAARRAHRRVQRRRQPERAARHVARRGDRLPRQGRRRRRDRPHHPQRLQVVITA